MRAPRLLTALALALASPLLLGADGPLRPAVLSEDEYAESFTFVADLEDGTYVQLQLLVTNLGPGDRTGACRALVVRPGKKPWTKGERVKSNNWRYSSEGGVERLKVSTCSAESGTSTDVRANLDGAEITLRFPSAISPISPPTPVIGIGPRKHSTWLLLPYSPVAAKIKLPGQKAVELSGGGYADHSRTNVAAKDLARRWLRFRGLRGQKHVLLLARESISGQFSPAWVWVEGEKPRLFERFSIERRGSRDKPAWTARLSGGLVAEISSSSLLYRYAPVEELGALGWVISPVVGSPVTYTHRAELRLEGAETLAGILEVSLLEE